MNSITLNQYGAEELSIYPKIHGGTYKKQDTENQWIDNFLINRRQICKGRYWNASLHTFDYSLNSVVYLNTLSILPQIIQAGIGALKIEGRQRSFKYVKEAVKILRKVVDSYYADPSSLCFEDADQTCLENLFRGLESCTTCYLEK